MLAATIGPTVLEIVFNAEIGRRTLTLLALGSAHVHGRPRHRPGRHRAPRPRLGRRRVDAPGSPPSSSSPRSPAHDLLLRVELGLVAASGGRDGDVRLRPARQAAERGRGGRSRRSSTPSPTTRSRPPERSSDGDRPARRHRRRVPPRSPDRGRPVRRPAARRPGRARRAAGRRIPTSLSFRAQLRPGVRRLRYPAAARAAGVGPRRPPPRPTGAAPAPTSSTARTTSCRPARLPDGRVRPRLLVPAAAHARSAAPSGASAPSSAEPCAARRHGPRAVAAHRRPGPRAARRRAGGRRAARAPRPCCRRARRSTSPGSTAVRTCWPSGPRSPGRTCPGWSTRSASSTPSRPTLALVLLGPHGPDQPAIDDAIARQPRPAADADPAGRLRQRRRPQRHPPRRLGAGLPVARRGLRLPGARGHGGRGAGGGRRRRLAARGLR